nr:hypothetical protein [Tanacetum cinerariifolium]
MRASLSSTSPRTDIPEADTPPRKKACLTAPTPGFEIEESSAAGAARQPGPTETDIPEADTPPRKKACLTAPTPGFEIEESSAADYITTDPVDYGTWTYR